PAKSMDNDDDDNTKRQSQKQRHSITLTDTLCLGMDPFLSDMNMNSSDGIKTNRNTCHNNVLGDMFTIVNDDGNDRQEHVELFESCSKPNRDTVDSNKASLVAPDSALVTIAETDTTSPQEQPKKGSLQEYIRSREAYQRQVKALARQGSKDAEHNQQLPPLQSQPIHNTERREEIKESHKEQIDAHNDDHVDIDPHNDHRRKWIKVAVCVSHFLLGVATYLSNEASTTFTSSDPPSRDTYNNTKKET
ncbi:hypothetical protein RFI_18615, partial [Reticulomyxa filosa]